MAWKQLIEDFGRAEEHKDESDIKDECYWSYFSPNGSLAYFCASKEYVIVYEVQIGELLWCYRPKGRLSSEYRDSKAVFHPTRPLLAWVGQFGMDAREDFDALKQCGVYLVDLSGPDAVPFRVGDLEVDHRSDLIFSPCGTFLYGGIIGRDDYNFDERKFKLFKIDLSSSPPKAVAYIKSISPIKGPSYCGSPNPAHCVLIFKDDEPHFLITVECKFMLAKIDFDGTVKWKMIASRPGPPASPEAIAFRVGNSIAVSPYTAV